MRIILHFAILIAVGNATPTIDGDNRWVEYKAEFGKVYTDSEEDLKRKEIYLRNKAEVDYHNALFAAGFSTYEKALNRLSDWTQEEIMGKLMGLQLPQDSINEEYRKPSEESPPKTVDWRKEGAVRPVKNQLNCGSCYAFSATGALEGQYAIKLKKNVSLSEQQIVDCPFEGCDGCDGGFPSAVFADIAKGHPEGLESDKDYPYTGKEEVCKYNKSRVVATDKGYEKIDPYEAALLEAVANVGPISVGIAATKNFQQYKKGIFDDDLCNSILVNHAVLLVGYGEEAGKEFWIVKNSWGEKWGENGYIRMARNTINKCGITDWATYPIV